MTTAVYGTTIWGDRYAVRADWSQASSPIEHLDGDNEWQPTGRQVADYCHSADAALREYIERHVVDGLDAETVSEIDAAMENAEYDADEDIDTSDCREMGDDDFSRAVTRHNVVGK